jgi:hypothetical protein
MLIVKFVLKTDFFGVSVKELVKMVMLYSASPQEHAAGHPEC